MAPASTDSNGGGIDNEGTLTVDQCTFANNSAPGSTVGLGEEAPGGGIYSDGTLSVTDSTFENNSALFGGAINSAYGTVTTITDSTIKCNTATYIVLSEFDQAVGGEGGGVASSGNLTITSSTITGNTANLYGQSIGGSGGGIFGGGNLTINSCLIANNTASDSDTDSTSSGGGVQFQGSYLTVANSMFSGNQATSFGPIGRALLSPGAIIRQYPLPTPRSYRTRWLDIIL